MPSLETFSLETRPDRARVVLSLAGELDVAAVDDVRGALEELRAAGWERIRLDVADVSFVDSQGLRFLIGSTEQARIEGWQLLIVGDCPALDRLLGLTSLEAALDRH